MLLFIYILLEKCNSFKSLSKAMVNKEIKINKLLECFHIQKYLILLSTINKQKS